MAAPPPPPPPPGTHYDSFGNLVDDATGKVVTPAAGIAGAGRNTTPAEQAAIALGKLPGAGNESALQLATSGMTPEEQLRARINRTPAGDGSVFDGIVNGVKDLVTPADVPTNQLDAIGNKALTTQDALTGRLQNLEQNPTKAPQSDLVQLDQTNIDPLRQRQTTALDQLQAAANGTVPSAAEILGKDQANRAAAQAYGNAAALQGGSSSGGALRQALDAQTQIQGDANTQLMAARAKEMSDARQQLVQGISGARGQESTDATTNANLNQNRNLANTNASVTTHGQDVTEKGDLVNAQNTSLGIAGTAAKAKADADAANAASANALKGAEIGAGAGVVTTVGKALSDRRAKEHFGSVDLVQLAEDIPGKTWDYKDPANGPGRRLGIVAQDAMKSKIGKDMVQLGPDNELVLDGANSLGAALAMSAEALRRVAKPKKR